MRIMKPFSWLIFATLPLAAQSVKLPGELAAYQRVELKARVEATVEKVPVDRGSVVKAGDTLIVLAAPEMQARIAAAEARVSSLEAQRVEAEAKLSASESRFGRLKSASATPGVVAEVDLIVAEKERDAARMLVAAIGRGVEAARAEAAALKQMESYLRISAPFDGVITARHAHPGALASPGAGALLILEQVARLRLVLPVPEAEWSGVRVGRRLSFRVPAHPGRTMPVELDVANSAGDLAPGMYCEVEWPKPAPAAPDARPK